MTAAGIRMASPDELRRFQKDFSEAKQHRSLAMDHAKDAAIIDEAKTRMRRTRAAALDLGRALQRMFDNANAGRELGYGSAEVLFRALNIPKSTGYWLMAEAREADRFQVAQEEAAEPAPIEQAEHNAEEPPVAVGEEEARPPQPCAENGHRTPQEPSCQKEEPEPYQQPSPVWTRPWTWLERQVKPVFDWYEGFSNRKMPKDKATQAAEHVAAIKSHHAALVALAKETEVDSGKQVA